MREFVAATADYRCEYCQLAESDSVFIHHLDHIIARKHRGAAVAENLALCCFECNEFKGSDIAGLDPKSGDLTRLFHPRIDDWKEHFRWNGVRLVGLTAIGRTTVDLLQINESGRVEHRRLISRRKR